MHVDDDDDDDDDDGLLVIPRIVNIVLDNYDEQPEGYLLSLFHLE